MSIAKRINGSGFTIVELVIVIVVIAILATLTSVMYNGVQQKAIVASLVSDLNNSATRLKLTQVDNSAYPILVTDCPTPASANICLKASQGNSYTAYVSVNTTNPQTFNLTVTNVNGTSYSITDNSAPVLVSGPTGGAVEPPPPVEPPYVPASHTWTQIAAASSHTCAIASDDLAYCWGDNSSGELGNNSTVNSLTPVAVSRVGVLAGKTFKAISAVYGHTCAIASDNLAYCWGWNSSGQLGNNSTATSLTPVAVSTTGVLAGKTINSITTDESQTCVVASNNLAYCWGKNYWGQLGNNSTTNSLVPVAVYASGVLAGKTIKSIAAGGFTTCVIASNNLAYCWGYNSNGQLGNNSTTNSLVPVAVYASGVLAGKTIKSIDPEGHFSCAIASDNLAYCWGAGSYLGTNDWQDSYVPIAVYRGGGLSGKTITSLTTFYDGTACVLASDNQLYCWGSGVAGELGGGIAADSAQPWPVDMSGALAGKTIKVLANACVIASDNQAYCWGSGNSGRLGNNSTATSLVPVVANPAPAY